MLRRSRADTCGRALQESGYTYFQAQARSGKTPTYVRTLPALSSLFSPLYGRSTVGLHEGATRRDVSGLRAYRTDVGVWLVIVFVRVGVDESSAHYRHDRPA